MPLGTPARPMPIPEVVRDYLADLLGKPVAVSRRSPITFDSADPEVDDVFATGRYVDDSDQLVGACIADLPLAASIGAALAMISAEVAKEAVAAGLLTPSLRDNYYEVLNIMSAMLNGPSVSHLRLSDLVDGVPQDVVNLVETARGCKYYDITIVGYTGGRLTLIGA
jgi:hypothetical protein